MTRIPEIELTHSSFGNKAMAHTLQQRRQCAGQSSRLLILGFALALCLAAFGLGPAGALAQPERQPQPAAQQPGASSITLSYSEAAPSSEPNLPGGMVGRIESILAGTQEAPLHAFFRVSVSGKLHKSETEPWRVTLVLSQPQEHIGDQIIQKPNLIAESHFMIRMLEHWSVDLDQAQVQAYERDGKVSINIEGPMDVLQMWDGPRSITLTLLDPDAIDKIKRIRFVRPVEDRFTAIYIVLYHEPFNIEVRFVKSPREAQKTVQLDIGGQPRQQIVIKRTSTDPTVYRSDPLYLAKPGESIQRRPSD